MAKKQGAPNQKRVRIHTNEERALANIEIEEGGLVLTTLRTAEEVRGIHVVALPDLPKPDPKMLQIAPDRLTRPEAPSRG